MKWLVHQSLIAESDKSLFAESSCFSYLSCNDYREAD